MNLAVILYMHDKPNINGCVEDLRMALGGQKLTDEAIVDAAIVRLAADGFAHDLNVVAELANTFAATRRRNIGKWMIRTRFGAREVLMADMRASGLVVKDSPDDSNGKVVSKRKKSRDLTRRNGHSTKLSARTMDTITLEAPSLDTLPSQADIDNVLSRVDDMFKRSVSPTSSVCCMLAIKQGLRIGFKGRKDVAWGLAQLIAVKHNISVTSKEFDGHFDRRENLYASITESNGRVSEEKNPAKQEALPEAKVTESIAAIQAPRRSRIKHVVSEAAPAAEVNGVPSIANETSERVEAAVTSLLEAAAKRCISRIKEDTTFVTLGQIAQTVRATGLNHEELIISVLKLGASVQSVSEAYFLDGGILMICPKGVDGTPNTKAGQSVREKEALESQRATQKIPRSQIIEPERARYIRDPRPVRTAPITDGFVDRTIGSGTFLDGNLNVTDGPLPQVIERQKPVTLAGDEASVLRVLEKMNEKSSPIVIIKTCLTVLEQEARNRDHIKRVAFTLAEVDAETFNKTWTQALIDRRKKIKKESEPQEALSPMTDVEAFFLNPPKVQIQVVPPPRPDGGAHPAGSVDNADGIDEEELRSESDSHDHEEKTDHSVEDADQFVATTSRPGTEDKLSILEFRYGAGLPLWHKDDVTDYGPSIKYIVEAMAEVDETMGGIL